MTKYRYTKGYLIYVCSSCRKGFRMFLDTALEDPKRGLIKPIPSKIQCPFCKQNKCSDVTDGKKSSFITRKRILRDMPALVYDSDSDRSIPINVERATPEITMVDPNDTKSIITVIPKSQRPALSRPKSEVGQALDDVFR